MMGIQEQEGLVEAKQLVSLPYQLLSSLISSLNLISHFFSSSSADLHFLLLHASLWYLQVPNEVRGGQRIRGER